MDPKDQLTDAVAERYEVLGEIGSGGMATVYLARDRRHGSQVAIKMLRAELVTGTGGQRFLREVQIAASLQHPNILALLDSGAAHGVPYFVMPYVEGETLADRLARETRLPVDEAVRYCVEVADGLAHAHARGFVHRDIKPGNILLSHGHAVIADFGIARALDASAADRITESGLALGTVNYMSPEQASGERVDARSDVYALGCVLYEMLGGTPPFTGPTTQAIMARHAVDPVPSLRTVRQGVSVELEEAILKALAKVPEDRYSSVGEFRDAVVEGAGVPVTAARTARTAAMRPVRGRRRVLLAAGVAAVLAAAVGVWRGLPAAATVDVHRVMVMPLVLPGDWKGSPSAGEDVATVIGSAMDGAGGLRWVDGWQQLSAAQRGDIRTVPLRDALAIARAEHCAYAITGRLVSRGDSVDVFLELHDVRGDSTLARAPSRAALAAEGWRGGLGAITDLLPHLIPTAVPDVATAWRTRPPQAVAHFLLGESAFRRVQLQPALDEFKLAIAADSTFGLAAIRGAQAASWSHRSEEAAALVGVALRQQLPPRDERFARGMQAYLNGEADSAAARMRAAIALDSSMVVAWMQLGEVYMHLLPVEGHTDSLGEAAFERALALDSTGTTHLFHLVEIARRRGDVARASALAARFARESADSSLALQAQLVAGCDAQAKPSGSPAQAAAEHPLQLLVAAKFLAASADAWRCSAAWYAALLRVDTAANETADARRFSALLGQVGLLVSADRGDSAAPLVEAFQQRWGSGRSIYLLAAPVSPALAPQARDLARHDSAETGADYARMPYPVRLWELGVWAAVDGRPAVASAVAAHLRRRAAAGSRLDSLLAGSMEAHAALAARDTGLAMERFERLIAAPAPEVLLAWNEAAALGFDRLTYGRLLVRRGSFERALGVMDVLDSGMPVVFPLYQRASLLARAEAADSLRRPDLSAVFRRRIAARAGGTT